jgi:sorting and assembly machinery component 37
MKNARGKVQQRTQEDIQYERLSWGFIGLALGSVAAYIAVMGSPIRLSIQEVGELDEEDDGDDDGDEFEGADHE